MAEPRIDENGLPVYAPGDYDFVRVVDRSTGASRNALAPEVTAAARALSGALAQIVSDAQEDIAPLIAGLGYLPPVPFASGLTVDSSRFTVSHGGEVYAPVADALPFTTTGTFNPAQWRLIQGVAATDLASSIGASMVGFVQSGEGAELRELRGKVAERVSILDFIPPSQHSGIKNGTSSFDCSEALTNAIDATGVNQSTFNIGGPKIEFPPGRYYFASSIQLKRTVILEGAGTGMSGGYATEFNFPANTDGIIVHRYNTIGSGIESPATRGADGSIISNVRLVGTRTASTTGNGVWLRARATLENVSVHGFAGNGFHIVATSGGGGGIPEGNANNWRAIGVRATGCGGHGVFVDGADVNAGSALGVDCANNDSCGIYDSSFLGNCYVGTHCSTNGLRSGVHYAGNRYYCKDPALAGSTTPGTNLAVWGLIGPGGVHAAFPEWQSGESYLIGYSYYTDNANAPTVFVGAYSEGGYAPPRLTAPAIMLGGGQVMFDPDSTGSYINGGGGSGGGHFRSNRGVESVVGGMTSRVGGNPTDFLYLREATVAPLAWRAILNNGDFVWTYGGALANTAFLVTGPNTARQFGTGGAVPHALNVDDLYLGNGNNGRRQTTGSAAPTTGTWARGSVVWNIAPSPGGSAGWICTATGTPGTWKAFGAIDP